MIMNLRFPINFYLQFLHTIIYSIHQMDYKIVIDFYRNNKYMGSQY